MRVCAPVSGVFSLSPTPAGVTPFNAVAPSAPSVSPPALRRRTVASTNDSPISQPTGASSRRSTNEFTSRTRLSRTQLYVARGSLHVASGINPRADRKASPAQTSNNTISTNDTSSNRKKNEFSPNVTIEESPNVSIEESPNVTLEESPNVNLKKSKARLRENKKSKKQASEAKIDSPKVCKTPSTPNHSTRISSPGKTIPMPNSIVIAMKCR